MKKIILLIIISIFVLGFYYFRNLISDTSDWVVYENTKYNFSFEYPPEFDLENYDQSGREWQPTEPLPSSNGFVLRDLSTMYNPPLPEQEHVKWADSLWVAIRINVDEGNEPEEYSTLAFDANDKYKKSILEGIEKGSYTNPERAKVLHDSIQVSDFREVEINNQKALSYKCNNSCSTALGEGQRSLGNEYNVYFVQKEDRIIIFTVRDNKVFNRILSTLELN